MLRFLERLMYNFEQLTPHILGTVVLFFLLANIKITSKSVRLVHFHQTFDEFNTSTKEFYDALKKKIEQCQMPSTSKGFVAFRAEGGWFSKRRDYLRFTRNNFSLESCAAPFGKGYFFSYVLLPRISILRLFIYRFPVIGPLLMRKHYRQSAYKYDCAKAFQGLFHLHFMETMDAVTKSQGTRELTEDERKPILTEIFKR